jgi:hypothetical protein
MWAPSKAPCCNAFVLFRFARYLPNSGSSMPMCSEFGAPPNVALKITVRP